MNACAKYVLYLTLHIFFNYQLILGQFITTRAINGPHTVRFRRQTGYVYNKPSISFDLPSRNPIISTSTQASPADRISMQMYYAYPAPVEQNIINIGSNPVDSAAFQSTGSIGGTGYNYNAPNPQISSTGNVANSGGYNYAVQNVEVQNTGSQNVGSTGGNNLNGYNYDVQTTAVENTQSGSTGALDTSSNSGSSGYNYATQDTVQMNPTQNTVVQNIQAVTDANVSTGGSTSSSGYSYGVQNNAVDVGAQVITNTGGSTFTQSSTPRTSISVSTAGVSTNAPKYLPPNTGVVTSSPNVQTSSTVSISAPSDKYLPPSVAVQSTPAVTVIQPGSNAAFKGNVAIQTSNTPNPGYLVPNTVTVTTSSPIRQTQTTVAPVTQPQQVTVQNYLPPVVTQGPVSTPASTYLPPVF